MNLTNKKILVTGADGFIGSHLTESLVAQGAKVKAFVYYNSFNHWGWLDHVPKSILDKIEVFCGDVRDPNGVAEAVKGSDVVFHLAALIGIPFSYHSPDSYIDTNVKGTLNILQAARRYGVKKLVHTSTSEVYGTAQYVPIDEKHPINPQSPYAASKAGADHLALSFYQSFDLPVAILRPFNTYGPRQSARAVIPTIISQIYSGQTTVQLGNQKATRDFNFVSDTVQAFIRVAESDKTVGQVLNAGSGRETPVKEVVDIVGSLLGKKIKIKTSDERLRPAKSEVEQLLCDNRRIKEVCGWKPRVNLEDGLKKTCQWIKTNLHGYKSHIYNI